MSPYPVSTTNLQVRRYLQQHSHSGMWALTFGYQMILKATTPLNSSPFTARRQIRANASFPDRVLAITPKGAQEPVTPPGFNDPRARVISNFQRFL